MSTIISDATKKIAGFHSSQWTWCHLTNTSVPGGLQWDCPTTSDDGKAPHKVLIALYNPSLVTHRVVSIPVYDALYDVTTLGGDGFSDAPAAVLCDYFNPHNSSACKLYVNYTVAGQHVGYMMLTRNLSR